MASGIDPGNYPGGCPATVVEYRFFEEPLMMHRSLSLYCVGSRSGRHAIPGQALRASLFAIAAALLVLCWACGQHEPEAPAGSIRTEDLRGSPLYIVLEPEAIPSIDEPRFVSAAEATFLQEDEPVLGVFDGNVAKAYSIWQLDHHEIVNDMLGDTPIAATW